MTCHKSLRRRLLLGLIILSGCLTLMDTPAYPEAYIAGQFGYQFPGSLSNYQLTSALAPGASVTGPVVGNLTDSIMIGAKLGYYSQSVRWFGVETELFWTNPHFKQTVSTFNQAPGFVCATTLTPSCYTTTPGSSLTVFTWAPLNLMFRYPGKRLQPYVGIGPGLFRANRSTGGTDESQSDFAIGLNAQLGLRYFMNRHLALFGEYKFNYVKFNFTETAAALDGFKGTYTPNIFVLGIGYHF